MEFHPLEDSSETADVYAPIVFESLNPRSVLDLGCNTGKWLDAFAACGVEELVGVDGDNMAEHVSHAFVSHDLRLPLMLYRRFDLVLCLEVAEHLEEAHADTLVRSVSDHTDQVFWSSATPGQGGWMHHNEQPVSYWDDKFRALGFRVEVPVLPVTAHAYYGNTARFYLR